MQLELERFDEYFGTILENTPSEQALDDLLDDERFDDFRAVGAEIQAELLDHIHKVATPGTHRDLLTLRNHMMRWSAALDGANHP